MELRGLDSLKLDKSPLCHQCNASESFNNLKKLITPERNSLGSNIIEALECLKA